MEWRTTDAFVVGYPKTGNTWLRFMLGRYAQMRGDLPAPPLFDEVDRWGRRLRYQDLPRVTFTHHPLTWASQAAGDLAAPDVTESFARSSVVLLVRHPLDTLVSNWFQQQKRATPRFEGSLQAFLEDPVFGLDKLLRFYELWEAAAFSPRAVLFRYEDARVNPREALRRVLDHLGADPTEDELAEAVSYGSFENMQQIELSGSGPLYRSSGHSVFATGAPSDPDALHVRKGEVGGYREHLGALAAAYEAIVGERMPSRYGYGAGDVN